MRFNFSFNPEYGQSFDGYQCYLESISHLLPFALYQFAVDPNRHNFSRSSLHDAQVIAFQDELVESNRLDSQLVLLGAYRDRKFTFNFLNAKKENSFDIQSGICLITFEIGLDESEGDRNLYFGAECDSGEELQVVASEIEILEEFL